jgi:hypothetical protein
MAARSIGLVADLWRYPVKSFGGERIRTIFVGPFGFHGDRRFAAITPDGSVVTARRKSAILGFRARFPDPDQIEHVSVIAPDGHELAIDDPELTELLTAALGHDAQMARSGAGVFDAAPIHVLTDTSLRELEEWVGQELDVARFRPNIVIEFEPGLPAFAEAGWVGRYLEIGQLIIQIISPTERCVVTTIDPDTLDRDRAVLASLAAHRDNLFGVYGQVVAPGWLHVGDPITLRTEISQGDPSQTPPRPHRIARASNGGGSTDTANPSINRARPSVDAEPVGTAVPKDPCDASGTAHQQNCLQNADLPPLPG